MSWLFGPIITSILAAVLIVKVWSLLIDLLGFGVTGTKAGIAKAGIFIGTWTAVTVGMGMRSFTGKVRKLRQGTEAIKVFSKDEKP